jgi:hypothetical protein
MGRKGMAAVALAVTMIVPVAARAHEGHTHKVMGTVAQRHDNQLEVKTTDGKTVTIVVNEKTVVLRGKTKLDLSAVKAGERVVVNIGDGKAPVTAREIKLGEVATADKK